MSPTATTAERWSRATLTGLAITGLGTTAHASAGGLLPGPAGMAFLGICCVALALPAMRREVTTGRLLVLLVGGQTAVHALLSAMAGHQGQAAVRTVYRPGEAPFAAAGLHPGSFPTSEAAPPALPSWIVHAVSDLIHQPLMAASHLAAAVAVALWLRLGEQALWSLIRLGSSSIARILTAAADLGTSSTGPANLPVFVDRHQIIRPREALWDGRPARRGPPTPLPTR